MRSGGCGSIVVLLQYSSGCTREHLLSSRHFPWVMSSWPNHFTAALPEPSRTSVCGGGQRSWRPDYYPGMWVLYFGFCTPNSDLDHVQRTVLGKGKYPINPICLPHSYPLAQPSSHGPPLLSQWEQNRNQEGRGRTVLHRNATGMA